LKACAPYNVKQGVSAGGVVMLVGLLCFTNVNPSYMHEHQTGIVLICDTGLNRALKKKCLLKQCSLHNLT
jgi:hypothetical protein